MRLLHTRFLQKRADWTRQVAEAFSYSKYEKGLESFAN